MTSSDSPTTVLSRRVQRSANQTHCQVGDVFVLMALDTGEYFELNRVGSQIWRELDSSIPIQELIERLRQTFDVDRATCEIEVLAWVEKMQGFRLVDVTD